jgi:hypothetical protein
LQADSLSCLLGFPVEPGGILGAFIAFEDFRALRSACILGHWEYIDANSIHLL